LRKKQSVQRDLTKTAIKKLTNVDLFMDELWDKVDNKELSKAVSDLREAINILNQTS
jgi:hypothetical protein